MISQEKQRLRENIRKKMMKCSVLEMTYASEKMRLALDAWPLWKEACFACVFCARTGEPDLLTPWPPHKTLVFPRIEGTRLSLRIVRKREELVRGVFGIWEPSGDAPLVETMPSIILVPGLAFDKAGGRLGRGRGYYDRLLAATPGFRLGVCFDDQIYSSVPQESHDMRMDALLTTEGIVLCDRKNMT